ncbi:MAG: FlgD immunoglobulin-like domain containing protein [Bacteroidota bacterium]
MMKSKTIRQPRGRPRRQALFLALAIVLAFSSQDVWGQNLANTGRILNTGTIRVKNQAVGMPDTLNGIFELFGSNQPVPGKSYAVLSLTGSGTKTADGDIRIFNQLSVAAAVTLQVPPTFVVTLDSLSRLTENGYVAGRVRTSVVLTGAATQSDFGGIGAAVTWSGTAPGLTTVERISGIPVVINGKQSIGRVIDIHPSVDTSLAASLAFSYTNGEAIGSDSSTLELWRSPDNGSTWRRQHGNRGTGQISRSSIRSFGRWTIADASNMLGPIQYEYDPDSMRVIAGNEQLRPIRSTITPFVARVVDAFDQPVIGATVQFSIDTIPLGATGQVLSATSAVTDQNGFVSTTLTLGNAIGRYSVQAQVPGVLTASIRFGVTARTTAQILANTFGDGQVDSIRTVLLPFVVRAKDSLNNPVQGVDVRFRILSVPTGAAGHRLSDTILVTDALGDARDTLTLGTKVGEYRILAYSPDIPGVTDTFSVSATHGFAAKMLQAGDAQADTISTVLQPLTVTVTDGYDNVVPGATVQFAVVDTPAAAVGHTLSAKFATTDAGGIATTLLTLGDKVGTYRVNAVSRSLVNIVRVFFAQAKPGVPAAIDSVRGWNQTKPILASLDTALTVRVVDRGGNVKSGVPVSFALTSKPSGASGDSLTRAVDTTNSLGEASTVLRLGTKVGRYSVTASSPALVGATRVFGASALPGAPVLAAKDSGDAQLAPIGTQLAPFVVTVLDLGGNPIPNVPVQFTATKVPTGSVGYGLTKAVDTTNALGQASTALVFGNKHGIYQVQATVTGVPGVTFSATAQFNIADANNDGSLDVADLTMMIDHILGHITLTGYDFFRSDVNADGVVDIRDVILVVEKLSTDKWGAAEAVVDSIMNSSSRVANLGLVRATKPQQPAAVSALGEFEITDKTGLVRFNLTNDVLVKGVQVALKLRKPVTINRADVVFSRAKNMTIRVFSQADTVRILVYNLQNTPIDTGSGALFRLDLKLTDTTDILSKEVVISTGSNIATHIASANLAVASVQRPLTYQLYQNYPNPFNPSTTIEYDVPEVNGTVPRVAIQIFNLLGERVKTIDRGDKDAGRYKIRWDGTDERGVRVPTGVYFYRLLSQDYVSSKKMILIK